MSGVFEVPAKLAFLLHMIAANPAAPPSAEPSLHVASNRIERRIEAQGFAFSESRWIEVLHEHGAGAGQGHLAARIFRTRSGAIYVPVDSDRQAIVAARSDAKVAVPIAHATASTNAEYLSWSLGRRPSDAELMLAHLAGHAEATALIETASRAPHQPASERAPTAALGNPDVFFDRTRARTAGEVMQRLAAALERARLRGVWATTAEPAVVQQARPYKLGALEAITEGWRDRRSE